MVPFKIPGMRLKNTFLFIMIGASLLSGCSKNYSKPVTYTNLLMGTFIEISVWEKADVAGLCFNEIERIENKFSIYKNNSEISRINSGELKEPVSEECRYLLDKAEEYNKITEGAFDISYNKKLKYDLGGIGKGYAADRVSSVLKENNIINAMINVGGNLRLIGMPPGKEFWTIGIKDPNKPDRLIGRLILDKECGVSTSGNYEQPGHIINPKTGLKADDVLSVTIIASNAITADALSTGVFVLGKEKGMTLIEKLPDVEGIIIDRNGISISSGLKDKYENMY